MTACSVNFNKVQFGFAQSSSYASPGREGLIKDYAGTPQKGVSTLNIIRKRRENCYLNIFKGVTVKRNG